jgi:hypothetical protein
MKYILFRYSYKIGIILITLAYISACAKTEPQHASNASANIIQIAQVVEIPFNQSEYTIIPVTNNSWQDVELTDAWIETESEQQLNVYDNHVTFIDLENCKQLKAGRQCFIKLKGNSALLHYVLNLNFKSQENGRLYSARQLINFSKQLPELKGLEVSPGNQFVVKELGSVSSVVIPFKLLQKFNSITVSSDNQGYTPRLECHPGYVAGSQCSMIVNISDFNAPETHGTITLSTDVGLLDFPLLVTNQAQANLIISGYNTFINPANLQATNQITIFNNGSAGASSVSISSPDPRVRFQNTNNCSNLPAQSSCVFKVSALSESNGQSYVLISYNDGQKIVNSQLNVIYVGTGTPTPGLQLSSYGNLMFSSTAPANIQSIVAIQVVNNSSAPERNISFNGLPNNFTFLNYQANACKTDGTQHLAINESCNLVVSYRPTATESGNLTISSYITTESSISYITYLNLPFSASTPSDNLFITMGGYGALFSNTAPTTQAWSPIIPKPATQNAWALSSNESALVLVKHDQAHTVMSSTRGLFWTTQPEINFATNATLATSIIYANNKYYVSGYDSGNLGYIYSSSNLQSWSQEYNTNSLADKDGEIQHLYWFNNTILAPVWQHINLEVDETTLVHNSNGTWLASTPISTTLYSWAVPVALYDGVQNYLLGYYGRYAGATLNLQSFSYYYSNIDNNSNITSAIYANGRYVAGTDFGQIYVTSSISNSQSWIQRFTVNSGCSLSGNSTIVGITSFNGQYLAMSANLCGIASVNATNWTPTVVSVPTSVTSANSLYNDGNHLWLANSSDLLKSDDGQKWLQPAINSVTYNGSIYIAVGANGTIFTSTNLSSWTSRTTNTVNDLNFVNCINRSNCFAGGKNGTLLYSVNGITWSNATSGTSANLNSMACGYSNCIIVGDNGTMLSTTNLSTWIAVPTNAFITPITVNINSISYIPYSAMNSGISYVIVGNNGLLQYATGNGLGASSWHLSTTTVPSNNNLNSIYCVDPTNSSYNYQCLVAGDKSTIYEWNKDQTWAVQNPGYTVDNFHNYSAITKMNNSLVAVGFDNATNKGWGIISASSNGSTWQTSSNSGYPALKVIFAK